MKIDLASLKASVDLLALAQRDVELHRKAGTGGGEWWGPCPFCREGNDRFHVWPGTGRFWCRICNRQGDVLAYVAELHHLDLKNGADFVRACELLGGLRPLSPQLTSKPHTMKAVDTRQGPPSVDWQRRAAAVVQECAEMLWKSVGERARAWLHARGLTDDTLKRWRLGYSYGKPGSSREISGFRVPCGIIIPGELEGVPWYLKVRCSGGPAKYRQVTGSRPALYLAETLVGKTSAVLTEGEFDALLLWQEAGDLAGIATLGSAAARGDMAIWGKHLEGFERVFLAYDSDDAGRQGVRAVMAAIPQGRTVKVPALNSADKDLSDYYGRGGSLRDWLMTIIGREQRRALEAIPPTLEAI